MKLVSFEMSLLRNHEVHSQSVERFAVIVYGKTHFPFPPPLLHSLYSDIIEMYIVARKKGTMMIVLVLTDWLFGSWNGKKGKFRNLKGAFLSFSVEMMILLVCYSRDQYSHSRESF